jgi:hypothetical protein
VLILVTVGVAVAVVCGSVGLFTANTGEEAASSMMLSVLAGALIIVLALFGPAMFGAAGLP